MPLRLLKKSKSEVPGQSCRALPSAENGEDGPEAASGAAKRLGVRARHAALTAIGCRSSRGRSLMRRREFIAGLGSAATGPLTAKAQQPGMAIIGYLRCEKSLRTMQLITLSVVQGTSNQWRATNET